MQRPPRTLHPEPLAAPPISIRLSEEDVEALEQAREAVGSYTAPASKTTTLRVALHIAAGVVSERPDLLAGVAASEPKQLQALGAKLARGAR